MNQSPTRIRYAMIAATFGLTVMLYVDRVCLSIVSKSIQADQSLTDDQIAQLLSSFFWAYALFQLPAGWLGDRFGPRLVLSLYFFFWSLCTGLMGIVSGFAALFIMRLGCGMFEAGAYPLAAGIVGRWMPFSNRALASGIVAVGGRLGGAIAPVLTTFLAAGQVDHWRRPFLIYGGIGMLGAILFYYWYRNRPSEHPAVNQAEADLIAGPSASKSETYAKHFQAPPVLEFLQSPMMWLSSLVQFFANFAWVFIITLFPKYLDQIFKTPEETRAVYQSYPMYCSIVGMLLGGWLSDLAVRQFGLRWGRALPVSLSRLVVSGAYIACIYVHDPLAITLFMCLVAWATDIGVAPVWAWGQDVGGKQVGSVIGWINMWGNLGAAAAPLVFQLLLNQYKLNPIYGWHAAFALCAFVQILAAVAALGINSSKRIVVEKI